MIHIWLQQERRLFEHWLPMQCLHAVSMLRRGGEKVAHFWGQASGSESQQVKVLRLDHLAVAAVDLLERDRVRCVALEQALHLKIMRLL